jgi:sigma-54 specific flagellar transcriptional regulator A
MLEIAEAEDAAAADAADSDAADSNAAEGDLGATLPRGGIDLKNHMSAIEIGLIRKALRDADGTVAGAARLLNIRRTTLVEKLRKYRLSA